MRASADCRIARERRKRHARARKRRRASGALVVPQRRGLTGRPSHFVDEDGAVHLSAGADGGDAEARALDRGVAHPGSRRPRPPTNRAASAPPSQTEARSGHARGRRCEGSSPPHRPARRGRCRCRRRSRGSGRGPSGFSLRPAQRFRDPAQHGDGDDEAHRDFLVMAGHPKEGLRLDYRLGRVAGVHNRRHCRPQYANSGH